MIAPKERRIRATLRSHQVLHRQHPELPSPPSWHKQADELIVRLAPSVANKRPGPGLTVNQPFGLEIPQGSGDRGSGNAETLDELRFAGKLADRSKFSRGNLGPQFLRNALMFLHVLRRLSKTCTY